MSKFTLRNVRIYTGGCELTSRSNKLDLSTEVEEKNVTAFNPSDDATEKVWTELLGGLGSAKAAAEGQWEAADTSKVDDQSWAELGGVGSWTAGPQGSAVGAVAWLTQMLRGSYKLGDAVGEVAPWSGDWSGSWPLARGVFLHPPGTPRTATGNGTAVLHTAVGASQYVFANLHVLSVAGTATPTITVKIQSDDNAGFSSPTDRLTFTAATARGGQSQRLGGAITDTYWRAVWTISGTTPSFLFTVALGIQ